MSAWLRRSWRGSLVRIMAVLALAGAVGLASGQLAWVLVVGLAGGLYLGADMGAGPRDGTMTALGRRGLRIAYARFAVEAAAFFGGLALGGTAGAGTVWFLVAIGHATEWSVNRFVIVGADGSNRTVALSHQDKAAG